ncbi:hypothetical protein MRX96_003052 [Rhipicephalus microplus]
MAGDLRKRSAANESPNSSVVEDSHYRKRHCRSVPSLGAMPAARAEPPHRMDPSVNTSLFPAKVLVHSCRNLAHHATERSVVLRSVSQQAQVHSKGRSSFRGRPARRARGIVGHKAIVNVQEMAGAGIRHGA